MKTHTTIKFIRNNFKKVFCSGYCDLQHIMRGTEPQHYNSGVYGWNCDIYCDFSRDIAITTGYRNMTGILIPDEIVEKYTNKAKAILKNTLKKSYDEINETLYNNRQEFFNELNNL